MQLGKILRGSQISLPKPQRVCSHAQRRLVCTKAITGGSAHAELLDALGAYGSHSPLVAQLLSASLSHYLVRNPTVTASVSALTESGLMEQGTGIHHDHYAYRTFGVPGLGIASLAAVLQELGYSLREEGMTFPHKKLRAAWFAPPPPPKGGVQKLPRVFVSEVEVHKLSHKAQDIIHEYADSALRSHPHAHSSHSSHSQHSNGSQHNAAAGPSSGTGLGGASVATCVATGALPWHLPTKAAYDALAAESEYAAWVLVHGYALNHTALATHRMASQQQQQREGSLERVVAGLQGRGFRLNTDGGLIKTSPDGLLCQASTFSDSQAYTFRGGETATIPGAYIEFVERKVLSQYSHVALEAVQEEHRRDGFEVGNADRLFTSTSQLQQPAAAGAGLGT